MKTRTLLVTAVLFVVAVGFGVVAINPAGANLQQAPQASGEVGRYRMVSYAPGGGIYMNDTATGECWLLNMSAKKWSRAAAPIAEK